MKFPFNLYFSSVGTWFRRALKSEPIWVRFSKNILDGRYKREYDASGVCLPVRVCAGVYLLVNDNYVLDRKIAKQMKELCHLLEVRDAREHDEKEPNEFRFWRDE